ncbi:lipase family protein [Microbacterium protaetiae]|nr:lipase family protein [Microbacterium protaetiae]
MPRWARVAASVLALLVGAAIITRPTTSLAVLALLIGAGFALTGVLVLVDENRRGHVALGLAWIVVGAVLLALPGLTVRATALFVGIALIVDGAASVVGAFSRRIGADERISRALLGVAGVVFGVLALSWPDVTLLVVAVVFGARLVILGLVGLWRLWTAGSAPNRGIPNRGVPNRSLPRRWLRTLGAVLAVVVAVAAAGISSALHGGSIAVDDFYAAPRTVPSEPGQLIRAEPFTRDVPAGARGWRILYTTTGEDDRAAVASGLVVVPDGDGRWPVIDWNHGTTGFARQCAPSLQEHPFESGALFLLPQIIENGWALTATDDIGLGTAGPHPYLIGVPTAHASLDVVRAARQLTDAHLGDQTVVWGHSQGGGGALWTGALASSYAPDVPLSGVAALAPAANLPAFVETIQTMVGGSIFGSFVASAYTAAYPDVTFREYIRPGAEVTVRALASRCLAEPGTAVSVLTLLGLARDPELFAQSPETGPFARRLAQNIPPAVGDAPLLIAQGSADSIILPAAQSAYVDDLCAAGRAVDYRSYPGLDHLALVAADSPLVPELMQWTRDRFDGVPVAAGCERRG